MDPGVLIAALISPSGVPAELLRRWVAGEFQIIHSQALLAEFVAVADRPKFRPWFSADQGREFAALLHSAGENAEDRVTDVARPSDPGDAYLVDLVVTAHAWALVTGDHELAGHQADGFAAVSPRELLEVLGRLG